MRLIAIGCSGVLAAGACYAISGLDDGLVGAAAFLLAIFVAATSAGAILALAVDRLSPSTPAEPSYLDAAATCGLCRRPMALVGGCWACERCDLARQPGGRVR